MARPSSVGHGFTVFFLVARRLPKKRDGRARDGGNVKKLLALDLKPWDIMTKGAFENAIRMVMVTGLPMPSSNSAVARVPGPGRAYWR